MPIIFTKAGWIGIPRDELKRVYYRKGHKETWVDGYVYKSKNRKYLFEVDTYYMIVPKSCSDIYSFIFKYKAKTCEDINIKIMMLKRNPLAYEVYKFIDNKVAGKYRMMIELGNIG